MSVPGFVNRLQLGTQSRPSRRTMDCLKISPLQCLVEDDYMGIAPTTDNPEPPTYAMRFCPVPGHQHILGLANEDGRLAFQDTSKVNPKVPMKGLSAHNNAIFDFAWRPDSAAHLVTVSGDQRAALWDVGTGALVNLRTYRGYSRSVKCVEWMLGSTSQFATGARDNNILLWDIRDKGEKPDNAIRGAHSAHPDRRRKPGSSPSPVNCSVTALGWLDDNSLVSTGDNDGVVKVWDIRKNYAMYKREPVPKVEISHPGTSSTQGYTALSVDPTGCYVYVTCMDDVIYKYDIINGLSRPVATYTGASIKNFFIKSSLSDCGSYLCCGSSDHHAYLWATSSPGGPVAELGPHEAGVTCVSWARQASWTIATCSDDVRHRLWRLGRVVDKQRLSGTATMLDKVDAPFVQLSPVKTELVTPSRRLVTPTTGARTPRSGLRNATPSIKSFFLTPSDGASSLTPVSERHASSLTPVSELRQPATPVSQRSRGSKRRLTDSMCDNEERLPELKAARLQNSLEQLMEATPLHNSPVKCTFSPSSYRSPMKSSSAVPSSPRYLGSPFKQNLDSPLAKVPFASPLPKDLRPPLTAIQSPTANLPNLVVDGTSPHRPPLSKPRSRQTDWLTNYGKQRKKEGGAKPAKQTTPKSAKKSTKKCTSRVVGT